MSYNIDPFHDYGNLPFAADDSLADAGGLFVTIGSDGQLSVAAAAGSVDGVLRAGVTEGFAPAVNTSGWPYVVAEEDLNYGQEVEVGANGGAVASSAGTVVGVVIETADFDGDKVRIKLYNS